MKYFKKYYRELSGNQNLLNVNRLVYQETPNPTEAGADRREEVPVSQGQNQTMSNEDWQKHQERFDNHIKALAQANPQLVEKHQKEFKSKIEELKKEYQEKTKSNEGANEVKSKVDNLITTIQNRIIIANIAKQLKIEDPNNPVIKERLQKIIGKINLTDEQRKLINEGKNAELTPEQMKTAKDALPKVNDYDPKKGVMLSKRIGEIIKKSKLNPKFAELITNMFNNDNWPYRRFLVMNCKIEEKDKALNINGKPVKELKDLLPHLPEKGKDFAKLLNNPDEGGLENLKNTLWNKGKENLQGLEMMKKLQGELLTEKTPTTIDSLASFIQLFAAIKKAFESGDFATLGDFLKDWNETKNPKELTKRIEDSKKSYGDLLEKNKPKNINQLLKAHLEPRGSEADALFGTVGPTGKYRTEARPAILNYLKDNLGMEKITAISPLENGRKEINGFNKEGKQIAIEFFTNKEGSPSSEIKTYGEDGVKQANGAIVQNPTLASLKDKLTGTQAAAGTEPNPQGGGADSQQATADSGSAEED